MDPSSPEERLLLVFKALAEANRLKILGLLSQNPHTGEQLAALLDLKPSTISHHLARLRHANLVRAEAESYYSVYHLEADSLEAIARQLTSRETLAGLANAADRDAYARMRRDPAGGRGRKHRDADA
ncbi:MAG TPA: metalloregulator ArsR/SmtB family transcription factor [Anaerolineales bacterium]|nr:metalloregulator ArsR/SmtB family transcription factor [Anaerolineales bacterium]